MTPGRNDPCHCGSGRKYKHCCQARDLEARSKDGAWVPASQRTPGPSRQWGFGVGETWDFMWTPDRPMDAVISAGNEADGFMIRQVLHVH